MDRSGVRLYAADCSPGEAFHGSSNILPRRRHLPLGDGSGTLKFRLAEIDAPEIDHPYGTQGRDTLYAMICGRVVDVEPRRTSYDRLVGLIRVRGPRHQRVDGQGRSRVGLSSLQYRPSYPCA